MKKYAGDDVSGRRHKELPLDSEHIWFIENL